MAAVGADRTRSDGGKLIRRLAGWAARRIVLPLAGMALLTAAAQAQTVLTANDGASLISALTTIDNNSNTSYRLNITQNISLDGTTTLPAINSNSTITIDGQNHTLDGGNIQRGFFVYSGTVSLSNITIQNAVAQGGNSGDAGGGGAGLGGALFVKSGAGVTVSNVSLLSNSAIGGNGGADIFGTGGGGGMGGNGGTGQDNTGSGGGGLGRGATGGGSSSSPQFASGAAGIVVNAASGGAGSGGVWAGGANGGGGGIPASVNAGAAGGGVGGATNSGINGGAGGFGGGGGGGGTAGSPTGGAGGFGGGGGGASGGVSAASTGGAGGFGGGGGGGGVGGNGGFGGGNGSGSFFGSGGGAGMGGALFVMQGGTLNVVGSFTINGSSVTGGASGGGSATAGSAFGSGIFLQGSGTLGFTPGNRQTMTISDAIADQTGSGGTGGNAGSWALNVSGGGTLVLDGANTYSGGTTVTGATLVVNGSVGDPTINAGGVLMGTGTVGSSQINAGGTFAPGSGTAGTSMTIAGNLAFASGATYAVYLNPTTSSFATVTGTASLAGTVQANFASGSYVPKQYTILTAAGGVSGTFSGLSNVNLPAGASDFLSYGANDAYLNLVPGFTGYSGLNQNQQNVANALTDFFNTTGGIPAAFFGVSPTGLTQLDGEVATGAETSAFQLMNEFLDFMLDPFVNGRGFAPGGGGGGGAIGFAPEEQASLPPEIAQAYAEVLKAPPANFDQRWSAWGTAYGGGNVTQSNAAAGSNTITADTYGFTGGMDYHLSPHAVLGFALGGGGSNWGLANALGTGRSNALQLGVYGIGWLGRAYIAGALAFTNNWFTTNRTALGDQLTANFSGQSYGARLEGGYRVPVWYTLGVTPYAALQAQEFHTPAYSETDLTAGGLGLSYAAMNATDVRTELGARMDDPTLLYGKPLILFGRLAWAHDFVSNPSLNAAFETLPGSSFTVYGAPIPHDSALTTAGLQYFITANWQIIATFEGDFAAGYQTYGGTGTLRYTW